MPDTWHQLATFRRSVLAQVLLFGCLSFVGPSIFDAISNLGGGGLSTPYLANLANTLSYVSSFLVTLLGGPLINKLGIKHASFLASLCFPLVGSAYYVNVRYGIEAYLLAATAVNGLGAGCFYVSSTTAMQAYPDPSSRGLYLGIWSAMMNSGAVIGGAINLANNFAQADSGSVAWSTYLTFVGLECTGFLWALLLSHESKVVRKDGTKVDTRSGPPKTWKGELSALWLHARQRTSWLAFLPAFYSFFYGGTLGTYLALHFSVRARALSSLVVPLCTIPLVVVYGKFLDMQRWGQRARAWMSLAAWSIPQAVCWVLIGFNYRDFGASESLTGLDFQGEPVAWAKAYLPFLILFCTGYWTQLSLYWILGTFDRGVGSTSRSSGLLRAFTTAGMAVSYGINSVSGGDPRVPFYVNCGLMVVALPSMVALISMVPAAEGTAAESKAGAPESNPAYSLRENGNETDGEKAEAARDGYR